MVKLTHDLWTFKFLICVLSGDLTRSVQNHGLSLSENPEEWKIYENLIESVYKDHSSILWMDVPGNHGI